MQDRCYVMLGFSVSYHPGSNVLDPLKPVELSFWDPIQQRVANVYPGGYEGMHHHFSSVSVYVLPDTTDVPNENVCRLAHICNVVVHKDLKIPI